MIFISISQYPYSTIIQTQLNLFHYLHIGNLILKIEPLNLETVPTPYFNILIYWKISKQYLFVISDLEPYLYITLRLISKSNQTNSSMKTQSSKPRVNFNKIEISKQQTERCSQKIAESEILICFYCKKQLSHITFIYSAQLIVCVGCFAKIIQNNQTYSIVNLSKKYQKEYHTLVDELRVIQAIEKYGIDSLDIIVEQLNSRVERGIITNIINDFQQNQQKQDEQFDEIEKSKCCSRSEDTFLLGPPNFSSKFEREDLSQQSNQRNILFQKNFQLSDILLASLHQKSSPQISKFVLEHKKESGKLLQLNEQSMKMALFNIKINPLIKFWKKANSTSQFIFDDEDNLQKYLDYKNKQQQQISTLFNLLKNEQELLNKEKIKPQKKNLKIKTKNKGPPQLTSLDHKKSIKSIKIRKPQDESLYSMNISQKKEETPNKNSKENNIKQKRKFIKRKLKKKIHKQP